MGPNLQWLAKQVGAKDKAAKYKKEVHAGTGKGPGTRLGCEQVCVMGRNHQKSGEAAQGFNGWIFVSLTVHRTIFALGVTVALLTLAQKDRMLRYHIVVASHFATFGSAEVSLTHPSTPTAPTEIAKQRNLTGRYQRWVGCVALLVVCALLGVLAHLIPPIQSPDEHNHLARAYLVSKGKLLLETPTGANSGGAVDVNLVQFWTPYLYTVATNAQRRLSASDVDHLEHLRWSGDSQFVEMPNTGYYMPLVYAPQALGLWLGRSLDLTIASSYGLARWITLLVCMCLLAGAAWAYKPSPLAIALMLLPMSLFQMLSPTLDGVTNCTAVLVLSLFMRMHDRECPPGVASLLVLALGILALTTSRTQLIGLLVLPFFVALQRRSMVGWWVGGVVSVLTLAWTWYALSSVVDLRVVRLHSTAELLQRYALAPWEFVEIVLASLSDATQFQFYQQSFIGILGWLDTALPAVAYPALWIGLGACAFVSIDVPRSTSDWQMRTLLLALALASAGLAFLAMLLIWTPPGASLVQGVQGRYFLVPSLMVAYALSGSKLSWVGWAPWVRFGVVMGFAALSIWALIVTLLSRYH